MRSRKLALQALVVLVLGAWRLGHPGVANAATSTAVTCGMIICGDLYCVDAEYQCAGCPGYECTTTPTVWCSGGHFNSTIYCWDGAR